ncbi:heavy metal translocating P-type ATPase [Sulfurospirillum barnesii]|uniref:Copper-transporting ATPase n=1 Tax=Sulfurospirillum barnesii (strain ATCC 700032 / DSM 10660 / SES-3) TaxID=760154 RepID=I3XZ19_SULBS|nr:heavy metal translocating P-type ATPase [Sulfurospirillum barnesii]AFL69193.1 copper/silver-translocating P-type ATPase,heavy metal-translocating P-type ATPase, Cd/Co/Hg/Pb/Zn-transporting [Sulfurospirillum barnesii SES-3]
MSKQRCDHCHLEYDTSILLEDVHFNPPKFFCCKGCQGIYHLLQEEGLENFYEKMGETTLVPPKAHLEESVRFDLEGFVSKYVKQTPEGLSEISLIIEGIHCSACVWLNEKVISKQEGVVEVSINYSNHKAKIVWDSSLTKLSKIIEAIRSIGYNAYPYDPKGGEERANALRREYYSKLLVGVFATMNVMWIAIAQYAGYFTGMQENVKNILNFAGFVLATPTLFYTGSVYFKGAYYGLKNRYITMDFLVATGATLAYSFSIYAMFSKSAEVYFDSVTMIVTFVFAGKYLEVLSKKKAVDTLDAYGGVLPTEVLVIQGNEKALVRVESVGVGDVIEVKAGDKIVIDGLITQGEGSFDLSHLSGESEPVLLKKGDKLLSGALCLDSVIRYEASSTFSSSMLTRLVALLEDALSKKPHIEKFANQLSGYFSRTILFLALCTWTFWYFQSGSFETALIVAISVIVIACPCALSLATPVATLVGLGLAAKRGILFKEAGFLESMAKCDTLILDKTGTITKGKPDVVEMKTLKIVDFSLIYALANASNHPISQGVVRFIKEREELLHVKALEQIKSFEAKGLSAVYEGHVLLGGNAKMMQEAGIEIVLEEQFDALSHYFFAIDGELVAIFGLKDSLKEGAKESIDALRALGLEIIMLSGDHQRVSETIAKEVGITTFKAGLLPDEKASYIETLRQQTKKVVMAGDGINDTLALSQSEIAIAMGSGADVAVEVSDIILTNDSMKSLHDAFVISRMSLKVIKENLAFSLLYNVVTIPLAMSGHVIPLIAALSMSLSSLVVVGNSMRIKHVLKGL